MRQPHEVIWIDRHREPQCPPDPAFPDGKHIDAGVEPSCRVELPYPAPRCGYWLVRCHACHTDALVTTAGRPDDPRSIKLPCERGRAPQA